MSDTYFDLPSRLEDSFPEIDSDIVTDLRKNNEEYAEIQQQISELKKQFPCIMNVMEEKGEIHLTAEEHAAFVQCLRLQRKLDDKVKSTCYFAHKLTTLLFKIHIYSTEIKVLIKRGTISRIWRYYFCLLVI